MQEVDILLEEKSVGKAWIRREGLYWQISCRCQIPKGRVYRLITQGQNLGIPVPQGQEFRLDTRIPAKKLGDITAIFAVPKAEESFAPVSADGPFPFLHCLTGARLAERNGTVGILYRSMDSSTGQ